MRLVLILGMVILLCACSSNKIAPVEYKHVAIELPPDPVLPVYALNKKSKPNEVVKAWIASAMALKKWNEIVRHQIENS